MGDAVFAGFVTSGLGQHGPEISFDQILRNAASGPIVGAQRGLRDYMALFGGKRKPAHGFGIVLGNIFARSVTSSNGELCGSVALLGQFANAFRAAYTRDVGRRRRGSRRN